jgi:parallel beta helix pectate lyase-like protein
MRFKQGMAVLVATATGLVAVPAAASAASLWVAHAPTVSGSGKSCTSPGYSTIQSALAKAAPGAKIEVCTGTYVEQLQLTTPVSIVAAGPVTVQLPAKPQDSTTACDTAKGTESYDADQDAIAVCGPGAYSISGVTLEADWPAGTCYDSLYGILVGGGAELKLTDSSIAGAGADPINGCQGGVGIQVGMAWTTPVEVGTATLTNDTIAGYQKNGVTVDGAGSGATITSTTVTGAGPTEVTAQNGIQVSNGAQAKISESTVTGDECNLTLSKAELEKGAIECGENSMADYQAAGILFFGAAAGSSVSKSTISDSDIGVYTYDASEAAPTSSQATISDDTLTNDRYESVVLDQGWTTVKDDALEGGNVGIQLLQYAGQSYGPVGSGSGDTISGMHDWAVQGYSDENTVEDRPGSFSIVKSAISGNPSGASVSNSVTSNSKSLAITTAKSDS